MNIFTIPKTKDCGLIGKGYIIFAKDNRLTCEKAGWNDMLNDPHTVYEMSEHVGDEMKYPSMKELLGNKDTKITNCELMYTYLKMALKKNGELSEKLKTYKKESFTYDDVVEFCKEGEVVYEYEG